MGIGKLLQLFIDIVNANLFKIVKVEYLETGYVENPNIVDFFHCWITQGFITFFDHDTESFQGGYFAHVDHDTICALVYA